MLVGNADAFPRTWSGWFYPLLAYLLALQDAPLTVSLKAGRCEGLLRHFALVFFASERLKDKELLEDNSSSAGVSISSRMMGSFPLL